jgi:malate permease and related proteins
MLTIKILISIAEIFATFSIGGLCRGLGYIGEKEINSLSKLIISVLFPMTIFASITTNFKPEQAAELWILPLLGFGLMFFGYLLGFFLRYGLQRHTHERMITFHHFCAVNNYVFLPLIVIQNVWGNQLVPLLFIMNIGSTLGVWTVGLLPFSGGDWRQAAKNMVTPCQISIVLALLFVFLNIPVPAAVMQIVTKVGSCAVPMMMILIGAAIFGSRNAMFKARRDVFYLILVRLVLIPALCLILLKLLPLTQDVYRVVYVVALMPVAASAAVFTRRFGGDSDFAGQAIVATTLASAVTIPLMMFFL